MVILSVDLGMARTGTAVCDQEERIASPLEVIAERSPERLAEKIAELCRQRGAERIVVGLPKNMDGTEGESARRARVIGRLLTETAGLPVEFQDERGTTVTAHGYLNATNTRGKKRKAVIDAVAAVIILEDYLAGRRNGIH